MDWNSATTKKHIKEAEAVGLTLIGEGRNARHTSRRTRVLINPPYPSPYLLLQYLTSSKAS